MSWLAELFSKDNIILKQSSNYYEVDYNPTTAASAHRSPSIAAETIPPA
jgi:hypothetical protein